METASVVRDTEPVTEVMLGSYPVCITQEPVTMVTEHCQTTQFHRRASLTEPVHLLSRDDDFVPVKKEECTQSPADLRATCFHAKTNFKQGTSLNEKNSVQTGHLLPESAMSADSFGGETAIIKQKAGVNHSLLIKLLTRPCTVEYNAEAQDSSDTKSLYISRQGVHNIGTEQFIHIKQEIDDTDYRASEEHVAQPETFIDRKQPCTLLGSTSPSQETPQTPHTLKDEPAMTHQEQTSHRHGACPTFTSHGDIQSDNTLVSVKTAVHESVSATVTPSVMMHTVNHNSDSGFGDKPKHVFPVGLYQNVYTYDAPESKTLQQHTSAGKTSGKSQLSFTTVVSCGSSGPVPVGAVTLTDDGPIFCEKCGEAFKRYSYLKKHMLIHTGEKPYVCKQCGAAFRQSCTLKAHMVTHTGDKPFVCEQCGEAFSWFSQRKKHMMIHTGEKPHVCKQCGEAFRQVRHLKVHMASHTVDKPFVCTECGQACKYFSDFRRHMLIHTGDKPFVCKLCRKAFNSSSSLNRHMTIHTTTGDKSYVCEQCNAAFAHSSYLKRHMIVHSGDKPFVCKLCGKAFNASNSLKQHLRAHTGEKPYVCKLCGTGFVSSSCLSSHMKTHTGDKPYVCEHCKAAFTQSGNLKKHMLTHTGDSSNVCQQCGATFRLASSLKRHMVIHARDGQ